MMMAAAAAAAAAVAAALAVMMLTILPIVLFVLSDKEFRWKIGDEKRECSSSEEENKGVLASMYQG